MQSAIKGPDTRGPLQSAFDNSPAPDQERTWAAGDTNTKALGLALKRQLSEPGGPGSSHPPSTSAPDDEGKGTDAFDAEVCKFFQSVCIVAAAGSWVLRNCCTFSKM